MKSQKSKVKSKDSESSEKNSSPPKTVKTGQHASKFPQKSTREPQTMEELMAMAGSIGTSLKKGDTVEGIVTIITDKEILVDIGKKSFGIIAEWELEQVRDYVKTLNMGDKVVAQVVNPENDVGYTVLSLRRSSSERRWQIATEAKEGGSDIEVVGLETAKGGLLADWQGLRGFIPTTQIEAGFSANLPSLIGRKIKVKV